MPGECDGDDAATDLSVVERLAGPLRGEEVVEHSIAKTFLNVETRKYKSFKKRSLNRSSSFLSGYSNVYCHITCVLEVWYVIGKTGSCY